MIKDPSHRRDLAVAVIFSVKNRNNYCGAFSFFDIHTNAYKYLVSVAINSVTSLQFPKMSSDEEEILLLLALAEDEIEIPPLRRRTTIESDQRPSRKKNERSRSNRQGITRTVFDKAQVDENKAEFVNDSKFTSVAEKLQNLDASIEFKDALPLPMSKEELITSSSKLGSTSNIYLAEDFETSRSHRRRTNLSNIFPAGIMGCKDESAHKNFTRNFTTTRLLSTQENLERPCETSRISEIVKEMSQIQDVKEIKEMMEKGTKESKDSKEIKKQSQIREIKEVIELKKKLK
ncbi:hypothetical protein FQR65_LT19867 [Abscondita terminalis]|nr:hypothetical protein FQR65_LT19867 [Abscondita terminalis]